MKEEVTLHGLPVGFQKDLPYMVTPTFSPFNY